MEFEQYLERDILTFLDSKIYKKENTSIDREEEYGLYLTKDYLKELNYALDNDELTRAKKLFDELKLNYSRLPKNSVERKKIYSLLERMYEKIQNYVKIKEGKIEIIKQGDMEIFKDNTEKFSTIADRMDKSSNISSKDQIKTTSIKRMSLPIRIHGDDEEKDLDKKAHQDSNNITTESNMSQSQKNIHTKYEKSVKEKHSEKNIRKIEENIAETLDTIPDINELKHDKKEINQDKKYEHDRDDWKDEIIHKTTTHLEKLKVHVIDKLLEELRKKLDEKHHEQNKKIDSLRKEIVAQVVEELDKRLKKEKHEVYNKIENLRNEILDKVYQKAPHIVSDIDNNDIIKVEKHYSNNTDTINEINTYTTTKVDSFENTKYEKDTEKKQTKSVSASKYSNEELRVVYEQAIYYMFENKYNDAAKLFKKIIVVQPTNKAAHIRLQECVEKQPELSDTEEISETSEKSISDLDLENFIQSKKIDNDNLNENIDMKENTYLKKSNENSEDKELETDPISNFIEEIHKLPKYGVRHKYNDDELQKMYEEAIYTMFQNNYDEAAELFQQILRIRPENKAARIRLQECREASGNA